MQAGDVFEGKYRIEQKIGEGGSASVYLAQHVDIGVRVAIKVLRHGGAESRFLREAQILKTLKSPSTVRIHDFGETEQGDYYIVSEFVDGEPLEDCLGRGPMSWVTVEPMVRQILEALGDAHAAGIVHRDIKPSNIMRVSDGSVRLIDFGVAKINVNEELTKSGDVMGTVRYMAPENLLGSRDVTPAADVFGVGLVIVALLTGQRPFPDASTHDVVQSLMSPRPVRIPPLHVEPHIRRWLELLLNKDLARRPATATAALSALDAIQKSRARPTSGGAQPQRLAASLTLALIFVLVIGAGLGWLHVVRPAPVVTSAPPSVPQTAKPVPVDPRPAGPDLSGEFEAALTALQQRDWVGALRLFRQIEDVPESAEAKLIAEKEYVRTTIDRIVAMPASPDTRRDLEAVLELYPEDQPAQQRLKELRRKRAAVPEIDTPKITIETPKTTIEATRRQGKSQPGSITPGMGYDITRKSTGEQIPDEELQNHWRLATE